MTVDAVVLAGGRSSRLGGTSKARLALDGISLVERAVAAASACRSVVVVGERMPGILYAREDPPFGGPAAGVAAGMRTLMPGADLILTLACDVPNAASAVDALLTARGRISLSCDGLVAVDAQGWDQPLLALYSASSLRTAIDRPDLDGLSMRALLAGLRLEKIEVPPGSTDDVDTWDDAARLGIYPSLAPERTPS